MGELIQFLFNDNYLPHGLCLSWSTSLIVSMVVSDGLISLSYFTMPVALIYFARHRRDFPYPWLLWMFAGFIMACGSTHLMEVVVLWEPLYGLEAALKALTAATSVICAILLWPMMVQALHLPSPRQLVEANSDLQNEIAERRRIEDELRQAKELAEDGLHLERNYLAAIVECSEDAIISKSMDGIVISWNRAAEKIFGYPAEEIIGRPLSILIPPERLVEAEGGLKSIRDGHLVSSYETERICKDGRRINVSITVSPILDKDGHIIGASKVARDITEHIKTEQATNRERLRLKTILRTACDGIHILDRTGLLVEANEAFLEMLGFDPSVIGTLHVTDWDAQFSPSEMQTILDELIFRRSKMFFETVHRHADGSLLAVEVSATGIEIEGEEYIYASSRDISKRKQAEDQIKELAFYDPLTRLPNRRLLMDRLKQAISASLRSGREGALLFVDLDNFKTVNDTQGHAVGDMLLQEIGRRLSTGFREADTVARIGGDEFVMVLSDLGDDPQETASHAETMGRKIIERLSEPYFIDGKDFRSTPSIGITLFGAQCHSSDELLKQADIAMYQAKSAGRNTLRFYDPDLQTALKVRAGIEHDLLQGIQDGHFMLHYQPLMELGRLIGAEALLRWHHPERGMVSPAEFIPLAEESGLILPLGEWVLETACRQLACWADLPVMANLSVAVNVSAKQFRQRDFVDRMLAIVERTHANPRLLKLELTESLLIDNVQDIIGKMNTLKDLGIGFSLDDFGTGFSSLSYLKRLPLDYLKIDQSFVRDVMVDSNDAAIARTVVSLARSLGLGVIAEGVETVEQRDFLVGVGCVTYQGYLFSRPLPQMDFETYADDLA